MSVNEKMTAIADAIREKTGKTNPLNLDDMASSVNEVYEKGKNAEHNDFMHKYQRGGDAIGWGRHYYMWAGPSWNDNTFYPIYDINAFGAALQSMFSYNGCTNIKKRLEECGVKIATSSASGITNLTSVFMYSNSEELPPIYTVKGNNITMQRFAEGMSRLVEVPYYDFFNRVGNFNNAFINCSSLVRVVGIDFSSAQNITGCFSGCYKLSDITVYGVIPISISFSHCPLTVESMVSIITHLTNYAGTEKAGKYTLTLKDTCKTLMAEQGAIEELGGKTYDAYIADIGWNLA